MLALRLSLLINLVLLTIAAVSRGNRRYPWSAIAKVIGAGRHRKPHHRGIPLLEQPNLSSDRTSKDTRITESQEAFAITKKSHLKKDWCKTEPFKYTIRERGCLAKTIMNRFCYGQCNSFFIPNMDRPSRGPAAFQTCSFCAPKKTVRLRLILRCPARPSGIKRKRIAWVRECKCMVK